MSRLVSLTAMVGALALTSLLVNDAGAQPAWQPLPVGPPAVQAPVGVCPGDPGLMYLATFGGGVLRSRDEGRTWQPASGGLPSLAVNAMVVDPIHCEIVYVATFGSGLFKTTDTGRTWQPLADVGPALWLAIDPLQPQIVYVGVNGLSTLVKSMDGGATWRPANRGLPITSVWTIQIDRANPDVVYIGTGDAGAFKSTDGGGSWKALPVGPIVWSLAIDPRRSETIYAGTNGDGVFRSDDAGVSFTRVGSPRDGRVLSLAHDPGRRGVVYAGTAGGGVSVSTNFGERFEETPLTGSLTLALVVQDTGDVYAATGNDGVFVSRSYGSVWRPVGADALRAVNAQNVYGLAVDPANTARVVAATNDGGLLASLDGGATWERMGTGFSSRTSRQAAFDPANSRRVWVGSFIGGGLNVSNDGGVTWTSRRVGSPVSYVWSTAVAGRARCLPAPSVKGSGAVVTMATRSPVWVLPPSATRAPSPPTAIASWPVAGLACTEARTTARPGRRH